MLGQLWSETQAPVSLGSGVSSSGINKQNNGSLVFLARSRIRVLEGLVGFEYGFIGVYNGVIGV